MKTSNRSLLSLALAVNLGAAGLAAPALASTATAALKGRALAGGASISLQQARAIALKARPGRITDQELEKERGGSGLRYSFDVSNAGKTYEVGVDAKTGKVLENGHESAGAEAAEAAAESKPAH